ncbi:phosphatase PAP2 family protein [Caulobacter sp. BK020]|uniref:acid phosphatase n=1 Tax=Caulobacter sp. BK020 TaxID=2512117 RepID=UPI001048CE1E|nr:phosphatase PAP2 family protein [Caulobacter sp. BK020]TCS18302.1 acid phosphatase (class A) [Caulobacter sp. BK020]
MTRTALLPAVVAGVLLSGCSPAQGLLSPPKAAPYAVSPSTASWAKPPPGYLTTGINLDGALIVGPPPTPDSPRGKADRATFETTRKLAGTPAWNTAIADADLSGVHGFRSFSCAAGVTIGPDATPTLARLLLRMTDDAATLYQPAKAAFQRPRPPVGNTRPICVPREKWIETDGSYPSGHGLIGWSWALVISEVAPEHASAVLARGRDFGDSRVVCGVHYPSDIEAGRYLGSALVSRLHQDPAFMADLAKARAEVAASRANGAPTGCSAA